MTENCNLSCDYCYERHNAISFDSDAVKDRIMSLFAENKMDLQSSGHTISFFGGEPLLQFNEMVDFIEWLEASIPRPFSYSITTNGTLITPEIATYLKQKNFGMLFSIDGDRDAMLARSNSYDAAIAGWECLKATGMSPEANMTFTPTQMLRWQENIQHVIDLGFTSFNLNPLEGAEYDFDTTFNINVELLRKYISDWLPLGVRTSHAMKIFGAIKNKGKPIRTCGAGKGFIAIAPNGDVYPCHHMVQMNATKLSGRSASISGDMKGWWESLDPHKNEVCAKCFVNDMCIGNCPAVNGERCGDFCIPEPNSCNYIKAILLSGQLIYAQLSDEQIAEVIGDDSQKVC